MDWKTALAHPAALRAQGLFLAEGRLVIEQVLGGAAGGPGAITAVLATPAASNALALEGRLGDRLEVRSPREMEAVTGFNFHRGVIALVRRPAPVTVEDLLSATLPPLTGPDRRARTTATSGGGVPEALGGTGASIGGSRLPTPDSRSDAVGDSRLPTPDSRSDAVGDSRLPTPDSRPDGRRPSDEHQRAEPEGRRPNDDGRPVFVVLEHLVDVDNVGSCFRNARAFGAAGALVDARCGDPLYRKAVRTSQGATLVVPWAQGGIGDVLAGLTTRGVTTVGLTPQDAAAERAVPTLAEVASVLDTRAPLAVLVGNEGHGLSPAALAACTHLARIPVAAGADSINVATALAVALYQLGEGSRLKAQGSGLREHAPELPRAE